MKIINLVQPENGDVKFNLITFPDGQPHIKFEHNSIRRKWDCVEEEYVNSVKIITRICNPNDLLLLLFVKNTLDYYEYSSVEVDITYLMSARMDRVMLDGEPFSLKVVANLLNQANFKKIRIFDPHSDVTTALIDRCYAITNHSFVQEVFVKNHQAVKSKEQICLVSPDAGAVKKIHKLFQHLQNTICPKIDFELVECMKERDLKTGALTNFKVMADDLTNKICYIVDDICDGGGTFAGTGKALRDKGATKVNLIVSHGIFSKGSKIDFIDDIYTTNSFKDVEGVNCIDILNFLH